jgi:hypothetical protein
MDIVDFGPTGAPPRTTRTSGRVSRLPTIPVGLPLGLAIGGAVLMALSLFGPWQTLASGRLPFAGDDYTVTVEQTGVAGWALMIGFLGLFSISAVAHFGPSRPRRIAALAGAGLCLAMMMMAALLAHRLTVASPYSSPFSSETGTARFSLGWGLYCAVGSVVAFGLSMLALNPVRVHRTAAVEPEPDGIDLDVRVESA